jgi:AcrR family transcriptional regulator
MPAATAHSKSRSNSARDRLLDVALELFATRGYQAIGLRDLTRQLGLHAGSLYAHFESKQSLLYELIEGALSDLLADTRLRLRGARNPRERLQRFVHAFVAFNLAEKHRLQLVTREFVNLTQEQQQEIGQLKLSHAALLNTIIATESGEQGHISPRTALMTEAVIGMLYGQCQWTQVDENEQRLTDTLTRFVIGIVACDRPG